MNPIVFWSLCCVYLVIQCIVVAWIWVRNGEITYKNPREFFGAAPKDRIRRADTPIWFWSNIAAFILTHLLMLAIFVTLIELQRKTRNGRYIGWVSLTAEYV